MAQIIIAGNSCTVESAFTTEQLKKLKKYNPSALILNDADKKPIFMVDLGNMGSISSAGIVFDGTTHDGKSLACFTKLMPNDICDANSWVMDNIGTAILKLNKLEANIEAALAVVDADVAAIKETIAVVGGDYEAE